MTSDLKRLAIKEFPDGPHMVADPKGPWCHYKSAAKMIENLRAENERLREALQGLANALEIEPGPRGVMDLVPPALDRARAALAEGGGE